MAFSARSRTQAETEIRGARFSEFLASDQKVHGSERRAAVDRFLKAIEAVPLTEDDSVATFLFRGDANFYLDWGSYEPEISSAGIKMKDGLAERGYQLRWNEWHEGHSWGSWRAHLDIALKYFYPDTGHPTPDTRL